MEMKLDFEQEIEKAWRKVRALLEKNPNYTVEDIKQLEEQEKPVVDAHSFIQVLEGWEQCIFGSDMKSTYEHDELLDGAVYELVCWELVKSIVKTALIPYLVAERLSDDFGRQETKLKVEYKKLGEQK